MGPIIATVFVFILVSSAGVGVQADVSSRWQIPAKVTGFEESRVKVAVNEKEFWLPKDSVVESDFKHGQVVNVRVNQSVLDALAKKKQEPKG